MLYRRVIVLARYPYFPFVSYTHAEDIAYIARLSSLVALQGKRQNISMFKIFKLRLKAYKYSFHGFCRKAHIAPDILRQRVITFFRRTQLRRIHYAYILNRRKRVTKCCKARILKCLPVLHRVLSHVIASPMSCVTILQFSPPITQAQHCQSACISKLYRQQTPLIQERSE